MWLRRFEVTGSQGDTWIVAISDAGRWGCSCPKWKFAKKDHATGSKPDCHHITAVAAGQRRLAALAQATTQEPRSRFASLDLDDATAVASTVAIGARFRHLDLDIRAAA